MERGKEIRFVEVKTRRTQTYGAPEEVLQREWPIYGQRGVPDRISGVASSLRAFQLGIA
jgi:hypothetical protein